MIKIKNLNKYFGKHHVLKNISCNIKKGDVISIIGQSGSGKSTLLRCMNLLEIPTNGEIIFEDTNIQKTNINKIRENMGMVFQHFNLFPHMTVLENITLGPIKVKNVPKEEAKELALYLLKKVGLVNKKDSYPSKLSGGQKQRIAIARAILRDTPIILFDEATSALDNHSKNKIEETINKLSKTKTIIIIAHSLEIVQDFDNIIMIDDGKIVEQGKHDELINNHGKYFELANV